jgi:hypothetical protein
MPDDDWLEPLDRRIEEVRRETEAIRKANALRLLKRLYDNNICYGQRRDMKRHLPPC